MDLIKDPLLPARVDRPRPREPMARDRSLDGLLLGPADAIELPSATEIASAAIALATGAKRRVVLPLASMPAELAIERRDEHALVSLFSTTATPEVFVRDRRIAMRDLLGASAKAAADCARGASSTSAELASRIAARATETELTSFVPDEVATTRSHAFEEPRRGEPVSFGYEATFRGATRGPSRGLRADVHALLFEGTLVAHVHGRRVVLMRGPIALPILRMLAAARTFDEARSLRNPPHVRVRVGTFAVALRGDAEGKLSLTLDGERGASVSAASLDPGATLTAIAKVANELIRELIAFDRTQTRNIRVRAMRDDARAIVRSRGRRDDRPSFVNVDADRMRAHAFDESTDSRAGKSTARARPLATSLRFGERWRVALDGLDAASTFLCGDRLVVASTQHTVALSRDDGSVLWAREANDAVCTMAGDVLLRALPDGTLELCSVDDGEPFAETKLAGRVSRPFEVYAVGGDASAPPVAIIRESASRLSAIDLRTGELLWRFSVRKSGSLSIARIGRMLIVGHEDTVHGLDAITGEELFRHVEEGHALSSLVASRDRIACVFDRPSPLLVLLDAFRGESLARVALPAAPRGAPVPVDGGVVLAYGDGERASIARYDADGECTFVTEDIGLAKNAESVVIDGRLVINDVEGRVSALALDDGSLVWTSRIAKPNDDVPRLRKPLLRSGVLFVPGAEVRVMRPLDGTLATASFPCDLIPDRLLVDERSWVYVAEESGHIAACAPAAHLTLVRGGAT